VTTPVAKLKLHRRCKECQTIYTSAEWNRLRLLSLREDTMSRGTWVELRCCGCGATLGVEIVGTVAAEIVEKPTEK
jgi:hypothetical protein